MGRKSKIMQSGNMKRIQMAGESRLPINNKYSVLGRPQSVVVNAQSSRTWDPSSTIELVVQDTLSLINTTKA